MINWPQVLKVNGIPYIEGGKSTAKNNIYVHCPLCGDADEGHHMGISVRGKGWGCWRNANHRGKNNAKLLSLLLSISVSHAQQLLGETSTVLYGDEVFGDHMRSLFSKKEVKVEEDLPLTFAREFELIQVTPKYFIYRRYLFDRGYTWVEDTSALIKMYKLHSAANGAFNYRIIIPVYTRAGLVTWTARSIVPEREPRYLTLPTDAESAKRLGCSPAKVNIKDCLLNEDKLFDKKRNKLLIVCEGPFDAMRLDSASKDFPKLPVSVTCLFGKDVSSAQVETLSEVASRYDRKVLLLDPDAALGSLSVWNKLKDLGFVTASLPGGYKDPAEMSIEAARQFIQKQLQTDL